MPLVHVLPFTIPPILGGLMCGDLVDEVAGGAPIEVSGGAPITGPGIVNEYPMLAFLLEYSALMSSSSVLALSADCPRSRFSFILAYSALMAFSVLSAKKPLAALSLASITV